MPLNSPESYEKLGEHLKEIDSIFQAFLHESGYRDNTGALGRYPHRSAVKITSISRKIDLQMETDEENGNTFSEFHPSLPYSLWAGAWFDLNGKRYCPNRGFIIFERLPFSELVPRLADFLREAEAALKPYTQFQILAQSQPVKFGSKK